MIVYAVERWNAVVAEMRPMWCMHHAEVALHRDEVPLDPDERKYRELDATGKLLIVTAREDGALVGYYIALITPHLHYRTTVHLLTDVYYVVPAHRTGFCLLRMLRRLEIEGAARGAVKGYAGYKSSLNMGKVFERAGWRESERIHTKILGGQA